MSLSLGAFGDAASRAMGDLKRNPGTSVFAHSGEIIPDTLLSEPALSVLLCCGHGSPTR